MTDILTASTLVIAAIGLIVTVIGWSVTAGKQNELADRQRRFEAKVSRYEMGVPYKISQIKKLADWLEDGHSQFIEVLGIRAFVSKRVAGGSMTAEDYERLKVEKIGDWDRWSIKFRGNVTLAEIWDKRYGGKLANQITNLFNEMSAVVRMTDEEIIARADLANSGLPSTLVVPSAIFVSLVTTIEDYIVKSFDDLGN